VKKQKSSQSLHDRWRQWAYREEGPLRYAAPILLPLSFVYGFAARVRRSFYNRGRFSSKAFDIPIVSVGNITVGGVGKTPLTLYLAKLFLRHGVQPAVVMRGYGRKSKNPLVLKPDAFDPKKVETYGDEAALISLTAEIPVGIGGDRASVIECLLEETDCGVILLDDGFQHRQLKRSIDLVVLDGIKPVGNGHCLPYGPLREPASVLNEADAVVFHANTIDEDCVRLVPKRLEHFIGELQWQDFMPLKTWFRHRGNPGFPLTHFGIKPVVLVSGIGSPDRFHRQAKTHGLTIHDCIVFPDHHWFTDEDIRKLTLRSRAHPLLMTEKDAIRLIGKKELPDELENNAVVIRSQWIMQEPDAFGQWLSDTLSAPDNSPENG